MRRILFWSARRWLFSEASTLIHLHTDAREDCLSWTRCLYLVREAWRSVPAAALSCAASAIRCWCSCCACWRATAARRLLRLMTPDAGGAGGDGDGQPWTLEYGRPRVFITGHLARHFARVYHLTPQAWLSQLRMALAARLLRTGVRPTSRSLPNAAAFSRWRPSRSASKCAMA